MISELRFASFLLPKSNANATGTPQRQARASRKSYTKSTTAITAVEIYDPYRYPRQCDHTCSRRFTSPMMVSVRSARSLFPKNPSGSFLRRSASDIRTFLTSPYTSPYVALYCSIWVSRERITKAMSPRMKGNASGSFAPPARVSIKRDISI